MDQVNGAPARNEGRIIERLNTITHGSTVRLKQLRREKSLRRLDRPHSISLNVAREGPIRGAAERVHNGNSCRHRPMTYGPCDDPIDNFACNAAASRVVHEHNRAVTRQSLLLKRLHAPQH